MSDQPTDPSLPAAPPPLAPPTEAGPIPTSDAPAGLAIASMVCGILGLTTAVIGFFCFFSPLGIILGLLAVVFAWMTLAKGRPGRGMAWAGLITGSCGVLVGAGFIVVMVYVLSGASAMSATIAQAATANSNASSIGMAMQAYANANNDQLPPAGPGWEQAITPHLADPSATAPVGSAPRFTYVGPVPAGSGPARMILYENIRPGQELYAILFADGHVETRSRAELQQLIANLPAGK